MDMRLEEAERHDRRPFLDDNFPKVFLKEVTRLCIDHWPAGQGGPGEVKEDAVRCHGGRGGVNRIAGAESTIDQRNDTVSFSLVVPTLNRNCLPYARSRRSAARACASSPSARPSHTASSTSGRAATQSVIRSQVRTRRNVYTERPPLDRAVPPVGRT